MAENITLRVEGRAVPKGRPRMTRNGGVYNPKTTNDFERKVANAWFEQWGTLSLNGKVEAFIYVGTDRHTVQDVDNLAKSILDGLQKGGAFADGDQQVYKLTVSKFPTSKDDAHAIVVLRLMD